MVTFLIISVFFLSLIAITAIYFWQKPTTEKHPELPPPPEAMRGLFSDESTTTMNVAPPVEDLKAQADKLRERAANGDKGALEDAHQLSDNATYDEVLNAMVATAETPAQLLSIASHVTRLGLPVNQSLAVKIIESWQTSPTRVSTAEMLHIAALSDNAETFRTAVRLALQLWREGKLAGISATELQALFKGEFWVLSSGTRSSGAGFLLKRTLSSARRELEETTTS